MNDLDNLKSVAIKLVDDLKNMRVLKEMLIFSFIKEDEEGGYLITNNNNYDNHLSKQQSIMVNTLDNLYQSILDSSITINKQLVKKNKHILLIEDLKNKEFITAKEFTVLYGYSIQWQNQRRSRLYDALEVASEYNKKILYNNKEVRKWFDNELK